MTTMTPNDHEKAEWARFAQAAYSAGLNAIGHRYSVAASLRRGDAMPTARFDALQTDYRAWLIAGTFPCTYPRCSCIVSTSTTSPEPKCPRGLAR